MVPQMASGDFASLAPLLEISAKDTLDDVLNHSYLIKDMLIVPDGSVQFVQKKLAIEQHAAHRLLGVLIKLTRLVLTLKKVSPDSVKLLLQEKVSSEGADLLAVGYDRCSKGWTNETSTISSMALLDKFQVDIVNSEGLPRCRVNFHVSDDSLEKVTARSVQVEPEQLGEMIKTMSRIRRQLFATAEA